MCHHNYLDLREEILMLRQMIGSPQSFTFVYTSYLDLREEILMLRQMIGSPQSFTFVYTSYLDLREEILMLRQMIGSPQSLDPSSSQQEVRELKDKLRESEKLLTESTRYIQCMQEEAAGLVTNFGSFQ